MTRLQGVSHGDCAAERTAYHHARLPPGAPEVVLRHTVNVSDPSRVLSWAKEERQRTFNHLVKRYKAQLIYGCQEPNCMTPTCLSFRRRNTKAPLRRFTDLSARTVACYLASQDDAELGLCHYPSAAVSTSLAPDTERKTRQTSSYPITEPARSQSRQRRDTTPGNKPRRPSGSPPATLETLPSVPESSSKTRKDPKSFTQNLFDTLSLRMVEWLPLKRTTSYGPKLEDETRPTPHNSLLENQPPNTKRQSPSPVSADSGSSGSKSHSSSNQTSPSVNHTSSTLEVKVQGHPVKRLSLEPLEPRKQSQRSSITEDRSKSQRKRSKNASVNSTPTTTANTSQSLPSPPALRHRSQKHRRMGDSTSKANAHVSWGDQSTVRWPRPESHGDSPTEPTIDTYFPLDRQGLAPESKTEDAGEASPVQSLSHLSEEIVDSLENIMFKTDDDKEVWKSEMSQLESMGHSEPWEWKYATHQQRLAFPFVAQSVFYVLGNPRQLLISFSNGHSKQPTSLRLDINSLDGTFRKLHRICPWETTLHSLWLSMEKLFNPPVELSLPKMQRRHCKSSSSATPTSPRFDLPRTNDYIPDSDAASIAIVALLALSSTIPAMDTQTWQAIRQIRASGSVMPDGMMRTFSKPQIQTIIETSDRFEHDLALRLLNRLARVISTRLALHEVSKAKASHITDFKSNDKCELIEQIILLLQQFHKPESSDNNNKILLPGDRRTTTPMVVVEWLRSVLLKEWDGKPELPKASAAGGALQLLSFLYRDRTKLGLLPEDFHTPFFADRLDPIDMPTEWVDLLYNNRTMHLLSCSFIFPPSALVTYFRAINHATMSKSFETAVIASKHVTSMAFSGTISVDDNLGLLARLRTGLTMFFVISVRRDHALEDALDQLWRRERRELLRPLKVRMGMDDGEEGVDQGGVQQEFFRIAMLEAMNPAFGMFTIDSRSGMYYFQPCSFEPLYKFELLGLLVSLAIYNGVTLPVDFPIALYRRLLGLKVKNTDHIRVGWPELAKGLDELLAWEDGDVGDIFMRTYEFSFNAFGTVVTVDMERTDKNEPWPAPERYAQWEKTKQKLNDHRVATRRLSNQNTSESDNTVSMLKEYSTESRQSPRDTHVIGILKGAPSRLPRHQVSTEPQPEASTVTNANRKQFVKDYIFWLTDKSVRPQYEAFQRGFFTCLDRTALSIFNPEALKTVLEGIQEIDLVELQRHTRYEGGWDGNHPIVKGFWRVVLRYPLEKRRQLLEFVTASDRVPVNGIGSILFVIQRNGVGDSRLPTSLTCFGRLLLPEYTSVAVLEEKLEKALDNARGFGVA
ncbi:ubiquitin-protein ligase E3A [Nannizzia gypsea CBS 118893]|uniref:HECT-type E3 ubiquitin transferase n=1 Tax=Arthroderma gypseum (strain ATCC MYA-4604 / CBS 118893) TaxID=535722 RepID=E4V6R3_ARTGP|nr:ubiquitin-protein ligase E3A [Nannizzia gypsea CBS 118893]EFQ96779.1 ubiquitin-protein ligase E3A [Nannizzia gypsea CBS 118893]